MVPKKYDFFKTKYGDELLIDLIRLENLRNYIINDPAHYLTYFDITLILDGKGNFFLEDQKFNIQRNTVLFTSPFQVRKWDVSDVPEGLVLIFEEEFLCHFFNDQDFVKKLSFFFNTPDRSRIILSEAENRNITGIFYKIENEINLRKNNHLLRALLYEVLIHLDELYSKFYPGIKKPAEKLITKYFKMIDTECFNHHSVSYFAGKLCITPGYLNEMVKKLTSFSAKQMITQKLMREAKKLLCYSDMPVADIAWKLGYTDVSYFVRIFRETEKITPACYRQLKKP